MISNIPVDSRDGSYRLLADDRNCRRLDSPADERQCVHYDSHEQKRPWNIHRHEYHRTEYSDQRYLAEPTDGFADGAAGLSLSVTLVKSNDGILKVKAVHHVLLNIGDKSTNVHRCRLIIDKVCLLAVVDLLSCYRISTCRLLPTSRGRPVGHLIRMEISRSRSVQEQTVVQSPPSVNRMSR